MSDYLTPAEQARAARWAAGWLGADNRTNPDVINRLCAVANELDPPPPETVQSLREELRRDRDEFAALCAHRDALTAERDEARTMVKQVVSQRDDAREDQAYWRDQFRLACDESKGRAEKFLDLKRELDTIRDDRDVVMAERDDAVDKRDAALRDNERFEGEQEELVQVLTRLSAANDTIGRLKAGLDDREEVATAALQDANVKSRALEYPAAAEREPRVWHVGDPEPTDVAVVRDRYGNVWKKTSGFGWGRTPDEVGRISWRSARRYGPLTEVLDED